MEGIRDGPVRVAGIAVSSQAPTMLPMGRDGKPVRPALIWMDRRSEAEVIELKDRFGKEFIQRVSGNRPDPFYVAPNFLLRLRCSFRQTAISITG